MPVSDDIREQRQSIKDKGFKYQAAYYWEYYRKPAALIIVIAIMVISIIKTIVTSKDSAFTVIYANSLNAPSQTEFEEVLGIDTKKYMVEFDAQFKLDIEGGGMDETTYVNTQKVVAMMAAKSLDVMTGDQYTMTYYGQNEMLRDLRDIFSEEKLKELGDKVVWVDVISTTDDEKEVIETLPLLIEITDAKKLVENNCYFMDHVYMGAAANVPHPETVPVFYDYLTK